jgi:hypothetical protein
MGFDSIEEPVTVRIGVDGAAVDAQVRAGDPKFGQVREPGPTRGKRSLLTPDGKGIYVSDDWTGRFDTLKLCDLETGQRKPIKLPGSDLALDRDGNIYLMAGYGANELFKTRRIGHLDVCGDETSEAGHGFGLMAPRVGVCAHLQANLALEIILGPDPRIDPSLVPSPTRRGKS